MSTRNPRLSIGLPVYNGEQFLSDALESLLEQTFGDFELIISDNASTDGTREICESYTLQDKRIIYLRNPENIGATKNFNRVFYWASGQYFRWAAVDDICAPDLLKKCVNVLDRHPDVVLSYSKTQLIDLNNRPVWMAEDDLQLDSEDITVRFANTLRPMKLCHNPIFGVMRREVVANTRLMGDYLAPDRCFLAELSLYGRFREIPQRLFMRRKHPNNIGTSREYLDFIDPRLKGKIVFPEWRVAREHLTSIKRTPLSQYTKLRLRQEVLRWVFDKRMVFLAQILVAANQLCNKWFSVDLRMRAPRKVLTK